MAKLGLLQQEKGDLTPETHNCHQLINEVNEKHCVLQMYMEKLFNEI